MLVPQCGREERETRRTLASLRARTHPPVHGNTPLRRSSDVEEHRRAREHVLELMRGRKLRFLVATGVAVGSFFGLDAASDEAPR